jgi:DNA-binding IclR family transcriptional regulator
LSRLAYAREENIAGVNAIAAPVFNAAGAVVGALAVAAPSSRFTPALEGAAGKALRWGARRLSLQLGWREAA